MKKLLLLLMLSIVSVGYSQCNFGSSYGYGNAPTPGNSITIAFCAFAGEYHTLNNVGASATYTVSSTIASDWFTIRQGTPNGPLIAFGQSTLTWTSTVAGTYFIHTSTNSACGTQFNCRNITVTRLVNPPPPNQCINTNSQMILAIEPTSFWADEIGYTLFNPFGNTLQSQNGFPNNNPIFINLSGQPQPYALNLETQGIFNDNSINYSVFCENNLIASGSLGGGQSINLSNLECNFNMPTQSSPIIFSECTTYGQFTDEYSEWTNGVAGTDYVVTSSVSSDWITITSTTPNGTVVAFGSSPLVWTAPSSGTYFIHVSTDGFCGEDSNCRDITVERPSPLPVTLTSLTTECDDGITLVKWETASEQNSDYFQIESSTDGLEWSEIAKVQAMGNSNTTKSYKFYDTKSVNGSYYRLKQVDFDGKFEYFGPISSHLCVDKKNMINIFPNPNNGFFSIEISSNNNNPNSYIQIIDNKGRIIIDQKIEIKKGKNFFNFSNINLKSGIYTINIISDVNSYYKQKIVVIK